MTEPLAVVAGLDGPGETSAAGHSKESDEADQHDPDFKLDGLGANNGTSVIPHALQSEAAFPHPLVLNQ